MHFKFFALRNSITGPCCANREAFKLLWVFSPNLSSAQILASSLPCDVHREKSCARRERQLISPVSSRRRSLTNYGETLETGAGFRIDRSRGKSSFIIDTLRKTGGET